MTPLIVDNCRAWLHAAGEAGARGVVLCSAHGFEEFCARQFWCMLAERLSRAGYPTLRFDYTGTADSPGVGTDPGGLAASFRNIHVAIDWMRQNMHVEEVALVGLRLGSLLAAVAAQERQGISHLAALAPVRSGSSYRRELLLSAQAVVPDGGVAAQSPSAGAIEVCGFSVASTTLAELGALDLTSLARAPAPRILMAERGSRPSDDEAVARHFSDLGAGVVRCSFVGYRSLMVEPTSSRPCLATIDSVVQWLDADRTPQRQPRLLDGAARRKPALIYDRDSIEEPVLFGDNGRLVGILCEPLVPASARPCVAILGSGRDSHIGWGRSSVLLARDLAGRGIASLRFDPTGIGDSLGRRWGRRTRLYDLRAIADVTAAIDLLQERSYRNIALYGACSGAYLAFHTAIADHRIRALALRNIQRFVWNAASAVDFSMSEQFGTLLVRRKAYSERCWRVIAGSLQALKSGKRILGQSLALLSSPRAEARYVQSQIRAFSARGGRLLMVYGCNDSSRDHLDDMLGPDGAAISDLGNAVVRLVDGADHNFTGPYPRRILQDLLAGFLLEPSVTSRHVASAFVRPAAGNRPVLEDSAPV